MRGIFFGLIHIDKYYPCIRRTINNLISSIFLVLGVYDNYMNMSDKNIKHNGTCVKQKKKRTWRQLPNRTRKGPIAYATTIPMDKGHVPTNYLSLNGYLLHSWYAVNYFLEIFSTSSYTSHSNLNPFFT